MMPLANGRPSAGIFRRQDQRPGQNNQGDNGLSRGHDGSG